VKYLSIPSLNDFFFVQSPSVRAELTNHSNISEHARHVAEAKDVLKAEVMRFTQEQSKHKHSLKRIVMRQGPQTRPRFKSKNLPGSEENLSRPVLGSRHMRSFDGRVPKRELQALGEKMPRARAPIQLHTLRALHIAPALCPALQQRPCFSALPFNNGPVQRFILPGVRSMRRSLCAMP
jgi:hypothetical protein